MSHSTQNDSLVLSYLGLRKAIGVIGILLPFVLVIGKTILVDSGIESSISAYYYTVMRDVFVGSLCAIGIFLMSYRGYEWIDEVAGKIGTIFAIGTALFPTSPQHADTLRIFIGQLHYVFAMGLFLTLAVYSLIFNWQPVFWLESLAIILFGISWFVKGEAILKDK